MKHRDLRVASLFFGACLFLLSTAAVGAGTLDDGIAAYESGDYKTAIEKWQILIRQGSPEGLYYLGVMYANGIGVAKDTGRAFQLYSEAAQKDHLSAQYNLGMQYATGEGVAQDFSKAEYWWTKAAERGLMQAQSNLGSLYYHGVAGEKNPATARKWLTLAAQQGSPHAKEILAKLDADEGRTPGLTSRAIASDASPRTSTDTLRPWALPAAKVPVVTPPAPALARAESKEYGPVRRGDTLRKIARSVNTEGVTLEQMLVGLYHANPDAFAGNMNILKTGKMLRIPEAARVVETGQSDALKEVRIEVANWNEYRRRLADAAGEATAPDSRSAASGRITTGVGDRAAAKEAQKEVLKLSKGEPTALVAKGGSGSGAPRRLSDSVRMLEEDMVARENALAEANSRIAQLEKTVQDLQRLLAIKGQVPGVPAAKPGLQPAPEARDPGKTAADASKDELKAAQPATQSPRGDAPKAEEPPKPGPPNTAPDVQVQPKSKADPAAMVQASPDFLDQVFDEPLYLAAGGGLIALLGGTGFWFARRRRTQIATGEDSSNHAAHQTSKGAAAPAAPVEPVLSQPAGIGNDVDPLAEADLHFDIGRDGQAGKALNEALRKNPENAPHAPHADTIDFGLVEPVPTPAPTDDTAARLTNTVDFDSLPAASASAVKENADVPMPIADVIDFDARPEAERPAAATATEFPDFRRKLGDATAPLAPEFKFDGINLDFDDTSKTGVAKAPGATTDARWNYIETRFDLAKAYQEMGDLDAAREVLREVIAKGSSGHRAEAVKLLNSLG